MLSYLKHTQGRSNQETTATVIWMHGLGASSDDFYPVVPQLGVTDLPIKFIFPQAPNMPVTINGGYVMPAWYDIRDGDLSQREDQKGLEQSQAQIGELINAEIERGTPSERIIIAGFSQGGAMTLQTGLNYPEKLGGLLVLSGYLPLADRYKSTSHSVDNNVKANKTTPIIFMHGTQDPVVQLARAKQSFEQLKQLGYAVKWQDYRMGHSVCEEQITTIGQWLRTLLEKQNTLTA